MTDSARFRIFACFLIAEHILLAGIGLVIGCTPLVVFNLLADLVEIITTYTVFKNNSGYFLGISIIYFVTCFQPLAASVLLGWTYGFGLYNPVMIPVLFYMLYMTKHVTWPRRSLVIYTLLNCIATLLVRRYVYAGTPMYQYAPGTDFKVSFVNTVICYILVITFSVLFIIELEANHEALKNQTEDLKYLANYDELTKLRNRRSMLDIWQNLKRKDYCVVMGDIDDFKKINDTYGHEKGDDVLKLVAGSMQGAVDKVDYVSRWGGEEFLMIVFGNIAYALRVIDKVQRELKNADIKADGRKLNITLTFGITECQEAPAGDIDELIRQADRRLYIGKNSGKNCIIIKDE